VIKHIRNYTISYVDDKELQHLSPKELIQYRNTLRQYLKDIKTELKEINKVWDLVVDELKFRKFELQITMKQIERCRTTGDVLTPEELARLDLQ
jgi:hypothetical protein